MNDDRVSLVSVDEGGERRELWLGCGDGGSVEVSEVSAGPLTQQVYDEARHEHRVEVDPRHVGRVPGALGLAGRSAREAIQTFLSSGDAFLSDLMDALDRGGIPYDYVAVSHRGAIYRPAQHAI